MSNGLLLLAHLSRSLRRTLVVGSWRKTGHASDVSGMGLYDPNEKSLRLLPAKALQVLRHLTRERQMLGVEALDLLDARCQRSWRG